MLIVTLGSKSRLRPVTRTRRPKKHLLPNCELGSCNFVQAVAFLSIRSNTTGTIPKGERNEETLEKDELRRLRSILLVLRQPYRGCLTIVQGHTKHLICGHMTQLCRSEKDCGSSFCLLSQQHPWGCTHGRRADCPACSQGAGACAHHHLCCSTQRFQELFQHVSLRVCKDCGGS